MGAARSLRDTRHARTGRRSWRHFRAACGPGRWHAGRGAPASDRARMKSTTVMLVDDHAVVRMGFRLLLQAAQDMQVVAEADSGEEACAKYAEAKPDVVVMDLAMAGIGGIEAVKRIVARDSSARILALSAHADTSHPKRVLKAGALGYLSKRSAPENLI